MASDLQEIRSRHVVEIYDVIRDAKGNVVGIVEEYLPGDKLPDVVTESPQFRPTGLELYEIIKKCVVADPSKRITADALVTACEKLCYSEEAREFGRLKTWKNNFWGFITADKGDDIFFHKDSIYGAKQIKVGERVSFSRHKGEGADRAFPLVRISEPEEEIPF